MNHSNRRISPIKSDYQASSKIDGQTKPAPHWLFIEMIAIALTRNFSLFLSQGFKTEMYNQRAPTDKI
ncbi:MAG: hypothetical protein ACFFD2_12790 [Promethearchaeota archaeon]